MDLAAFKEDTKGMFIQCKKDARLSLSERNALVKLCDSLDFIPVVAFLDRGVNYAKLIKGV